MSSPISIPPSSSSGSYVPVHRRTPGYTPTSSPSSSSRSLSPSPHTPPPIAATPMAGIYTPAELLLLSTSPLAKLAAEDVDALRVHVPEVLQTRKQRKALAWHVHRPATAVSPRKRTSPSRAHASSESEEDRANTWRRT